MGAVTGGAWIAAIAAATSPILIAVTSTLTTATFEPLAWTLTAYLLFRAYLRNERAGLIWALEHASERRICTGDRQLHDVPHAGFLRSIDRVGFELWIADSFRDEIDFIDADHRAIQRSAVCKVSLYNVRFAFKGAGFGWVADQQARFLACLY